MAAIPGGEEYEKLWAAVVAQAPGYGDYQARTTRRIPGVVLHRLDVEAVEGFGRPGQILAGSPDFRVFPAQMGFRWSSARYMKAPIKFSGS